MCTHAFFQAILETPWHCLGVQTHLISPVISHLPEILNKCVEPNRQRHNTYLQFHQYTWQDRQYKGRVGGTIWKGGDNRYP